MKKYYMIPVTEIMVVNTELMSLTGEASLIPGPGAPARKGGVPVF